jgi:hypothetical protein
MTEQVGPPEKKKDETKKKTFTRLDQDHGEVMTESSLDMNIPT